MVLFLGVARALKAMHQYRVKGGPGGAASQKKAKQVRQEAAEADQDAAQKAKRRRRNDNQDEEDIENEPLMEGEVTMSQEGVGDGEIRAYAHRDVKPGMTSRRLPEHSMVVNSEYAGNIMISDSGDSPILMDLGSLAPSPTPITSRSLALQVQDTAAEHSTMPYRAPELFDVKTDSIIDTKVDIWSLGCTLYACLAGKSPFEARSEETGGSLSICVLGGDWRFPGEGRAKDKGKGQGAINGNANAAKDSRAEASGISEEVKDVVRRCLKVEPAERPDIDQLITIVEDVVARLPDNDGVEM